ncbi:MAG: hypothetical protein NVS3B26_16100 [Mycobacteriales bacterium]
MSRPDDVLQRLFERYRRAMAGHRTGSAGRSLATAEAVIEARVVLYEHLVSTGWDPPRAVRRQLAVDAMLLEQPPTALAG